ncbi:folate receptor family protein [Anaeramoeba ignava]|uniref:Folate receptor family protein n=1 Tax=Anaeramoeba ignava TaxID=1746090 RepID=A0A9Q0RBT8_ANAIG|nr:folate receptor family protein [Anaeramoeba ignava]|eukprot:Anaeramoba_ignava/a220472_22.p1 GENE.a220472_22~~a220472_22.p1  ORF type:complete len:236 (-),score=40.94 a220472_22:204-911(-)
MDNKKKKKDQQQQVKSFKGLWIFSAVLATIGIVTLIIMQTRFRHTNSGNVEYHGNGRASLTCPVRGYYYDVSRPNTKTCCTFYDYSCGKDTICDVLYVDYSNLFIDKSVKCTDSLGLLSCSVMSPWVNWFAPEINVGDVPQNLNVCQSFCDQIFDDCHDASFDCSSFNPFPTDQSWCPDKKVSSIFPSNSTDFCIQVLKVTVSTDFTACFNSGNFLSFNFFLVFFALVFLVLSKS